MSVGATFITRESGIKIQDVKLEHLGQAKSLESSKVLTTIVGGKGDPDEVDKKIEALKIEIKQTGESYDDKKEIERLNERVTRLASGIALIKVGGATEVEMIERKHRIEDALEAVKSAQEEGIIPGGGVALIRASKDLVGEIIVDNEQQAVGATIVLESIREPARQMAINAGLSADLTLAKIEKTELNMGVDYTTGEIVDVVLEGIIDPVKVTRCALQNAASAASVLITTNYAIVEI